VGATERARRGWWRGPALGAALAALAFGGPPCGLDPEPDGADPRAGATLRARVIEATDGDTVVARLEDGSVERVRYIGIDTPESDPREPVECFGRPASAANRRLVEGRRVLLVVGAAYVHLRFGGRRLFVNAALVRRGYARTLTIAPNDDRAALLARLEAAAGRAGRGLWRACTG
jgi:micrococcal nuclease